MIMIMIMIMIIIRMFNAFYIYSVDIIRRASQ